MKVAAVRDAPNGTAEGQWCQRLTVVRGLDGTRAAAAAAGAALLAPAYNHPPVWAGAGATGALPYVAEFGSFYAWSSLANFTVDAVRQLGYDGAWFDSFGGNRGAGLSDTAGSPVAFWNPREGRPYRPREVSDAQYERLQRVWRSVRGRLGRYPLIWANNFESWFDRTLNDGAVATGDRRFMLDNGTGGRPFDGCSLEAWTAAFEGPCFAQRDAPGTENVLAYPADPAQWVGRVNALIDAARLRLAVAAMTGSAGCQSPLQTYLPPAQRLRLDLLHYASFLMAVAAEGGSPHAAGPLVGTSAFFAPGGAGLSTGRLWEPYTWKLGAPLTAVPRGGNVTAYRVSPHVYVRYFEHGAVVVCPGGRDAAGPTPLQHGPYTDRLTGERGITQVRMTANTARILLRA